MRGSHQLSRFLRPVAAAAVIAVIGSGCLDTSEDRILSVDGTGLVQGLVYFDANGNRALDASDPGLPGIGIRLLARGTPDTIARVATGTDGLFLLSRVAVGVYDLAVDPGSLGDTVQVVSVSPDPINVVPNDSVTVAIAVSFDKASVTEARALAIGTKIFVEGIATSGRDIFGDSTLHLTDGTSAIRATRVRRLTVLPGDSVRLLATRSERSGQPTLDDAQPFLLAVAAVPPPEQTGTASAANAEGGRLDAALVRVLDATITDTLTSAGDFILTVNDGTGPLAVLLDKDVGFADLLPYVPTAAIDATGVLVPSGSGAWVLKPRADDDLTLK